MQRRFQYRPSVLNQLITHGVNPTENTPPELIREFVNDLYLFEIRKLRDNLKRGLIPLSNYAEEVGKVRRRYPVLSLPINYWVEPDD